MENLKEKYKQLKIKLNEILLGNHMYCCVCLEKEKIFFDIYDPVEVEHWEGSRYSTVVFILDVLLSEQGSNSLMSNAICEECRKSLLQVYQKVYHIKRQAEIFEDYVTQLHDRINDMESIIQTSDVDEYANTVLVLDDPVNKNAKTKIDADINGLPSPQIKVKKKIRDNKFSCDYCNKQFLSKYGVKNHIYRIHNTGGWKPHGISRQKSKYDCYECSTNPCKHKKYLEAFKLERLRGNKKTNCPDCQQIFYSKIDLISHANKDHLENLYAWCEHCTHPFSSKRDYKAHILRYHKQHITCDYCGTMFLTKSNLEKHSKKCKNKEKTHKCDQCLATFDSEKKLDNHRSKHEKLFECKLCSKVFSTQHSLERHEKAHQATLKRDLHCGVCHTAFQNLREKREHMSSHSPGEKFSCLHCNLEFPSQKLYSLHVVTRRHMKLANPEKTWRFKCQFCAYSAYSNHVLEGHVNRYHLYQTPYQCSVCPNKFTSMMRMLDHMKVHSDGKRYECSICPGTFRSAAALKMHTRRHTGEKPYQCELCSEQFISASLRTLHKLKVHAEKSIACPLCGHMFHTLVSFRIHFKKSHWKSDEKFDVTKVEGLKEEDYDLFRDRRKTFSDI